MHSEFRSDATGSTRVILVRHGQSTYNAEKRHQGCSDRSTLTEKGVQMAHQTGQFLQSLTIDAVYSSPLKRAYQTAQQMLMTLPNGDSLPLHTSDLLQEIDLPAWEGLPYQVVRESFADDYRHWKEQPHTFQMAYPQKLSLAEADKVSLQTARSRQSGMIAPVIQQRFPVLDLYEQVSRFWHIIPRHRGQTLLVVSHGGAIRGLISTALDLPPSRYHQLQQSNCGVSILSFSADWNPFARPAQLEMMNSTIHLNETLPKLKEGRQGLRLLLLPCGESNSDQVAQQIARLQSVPIDFSLSSELSGCEALMEQFQHHNEVIPYQATEQDFAQAWERAISKRYPQGVATHLPSTTTTASTAHPLLTTGLIVAPIALLRTLVGQVLGLKSEQANYLQLSQTAISVLHYPDTHHSPILQALNFSSPFN
ncbi:MAG: histidine phosphatase family protein [Leptolyngbyaceae cyanobacterium RM2_2_4]|nr:histidine phosphatase family protein [Leptolyngbyaceae cyanobacterium SM1_4_3]NJO48378.1 histidine phosphatase family protein [Leptolyngbyaceae cyanobacterium RM2_2_4]